jgi:hypothetical protein
MPVDEAGRVRSLSLGPSGESNAIEILEDRNSDGISTKDSGEEDSMVSQLLKAYNTALPKP